MIQSLTELTNDAFGMMINMIHDRLINNPNMNIDEMERLMKMLEKANSSRVKIARNYDKMTQMESLQKNKIDGTGEYVQRIDTVYDIVIIQDILFNAMERFRDDLHLLGNFNMERHYDDIKKTKYWLNGFLAKHIPKKLSAEECRRGIWSNVPLEDDKENMKMFRKILQQCDAQYNGIIARQKMQNAQETQPTESPQDVSRTDYDNSSEDGESVEIQQKDYCDADPQAQNNNSLHKIDDS